MYIYKLTTYLKDLPLQSVSSKKDLQVVYISLCLYDIEHSFVFRKPTLTRRAGLTTWQMQHMPQASRFWGPRALLQHALFSCNTSIFYRDTPIFYWNTPTFLLDHADLGCLANLGASRESSDFAHLGPLRLTVGARKNAKFYLNAADQI